MAMLALAAFFFFLAVYPFTIYPLTVLGGMAVKGQRRFTPQIPDNWPDLSIVFCAHNEGKSIAEKLDNCSSIMSAYPGRSELLVYLDGCTDTTESVARNHPLLISQNRHTDVVVGEQRAGKSRGMNILVARAKGEIVVFTDANVIAAADCLSVAARTLSDTSIGCVCSNLTYTNPDASATAQAGSLFYRFEEWLKQAESNLQSTVGADGSLFALRRDLFRPVPSDIIDDMFTTYGAFIQGYRVVRNPEFRAFERHAVDAKDEFRRKVRIACRALNCMRLLWPEFRRLDTLTFYMILSHKIMRYFTIFFVMLAVFALLAGLAIQQAYMTIAILVAIGFAAFFLSRANIRPFNTLFSVLDALTAVGFGVIASIRGERYQTWAVPDSSRGK